MSTCSRSVKPDARKHWDLLSIIVTSLLLIAVIYLLPDSFLRVALGLPFLLFFPGYALITVLFPNQDDLETIERVALSFGLSIAITPLIGFGLNYTPFGIRLAPILLSISALNIALSAAGLWRREKVEEPYLPFDPRSIYQGALKEFHKEGPIDKVLSIILVISIVASVIALAYVVVVPKQGESFTEFYILGPGGKAEDYPHNLTVDEDALIIIGIANHEHRTVNYTIEVWLVNMTFEDNQTHINELLYFSCMNVTLDHVDVDIEGNWTAQWESHFEFSIPLMGEYKLWFNLYKDEVPSLPSPPEHMRDYTGTTAEQRIVEAVENRYQSLNLNLIII